MVSLETSLCCRQGRVIEVPLQARCPKVLCWRNSGLRLQTRQIRHRRRLVENSTSLQVSRKFGYLNGSLTLCVLYTWYNTAHWTYLLVWGRLLPCFTCVIDRRLFTNVLQAEWRRPFQIALISVLFCSCYIFSHVGWRMLAEFCVSAVVNYHKYYDAL